MTVSLLDRNIGEVIVTLLMGLLAFLGFGSQSLVGDSLDPGSGSLPPTAPDSVEPTLTAIFVSRTAEGKASTAAVTDQAKLRDLKKLLLLPFPESFTRTDCSGGTGTTYRIHLYPKSKKAEVWRGAQPPGYIYVLNTCALQRPAKEGDSSVSDIVKFRKFIKAIITYLDGDRPSDPLPR